MIGIKKSRAILALLLVSPIAMMAMERAKELQKDVISIHYTVKNNSGRTLIAEYQNGRKEIEPGPAISFEVKANPMHAQTIIAYMAPLRFFDKEHKSTLPLLLVTVNLRAPRGPENNSWTVQAWNENMKKIADWGTQGQTKNESMAVNITIPHDIDQAEVDATLSSR